jgi:hypothetical protein
MRNTFTPPDDNLPGAGVPDAGVPQPVAGGEPSVASPLVLGGLALAGLAIIVLGAAAVLLWNFILAAPRAPADASAPSSLAVERSDAAREGDNPGDGPGDRPGDNVRPSVDGDLDVADIKQPPNLNNQATLTERVRKTEAGPELPAVPTIPVNIAGGSGVPGVDQQRIDAAIARGIAYLKRQQAPDGNWRGGPDIGYTALAGLTLLECNVAADDPSVRKAAGYIRNNVGRLPQPFPETYQLSLAILFLDRLGDPRDRVLIQGMTLRLLAGQLDSGGWTYSSRHALTPFEMERLLAFLKSHRPDVAALPRAVKPAADGARQVVMPEPLPRQTQGASEDPFQQLADLLKLPKQDGADPGTKPAPINRPVSEKPEAAKPDATKPEGKAAVQAEEKAKPRKLTPINPNQLPPGLQRLPVVILNAAKGKVTVQHGQGDNSNTQFALLGLWAARRHDVPTEYSLQLAGQRFMVSQNVDGGWGYHMDRDSTHTMTCVGLIGLAMGHGAQAGPRDPGKAKWEDAAIARGLRALGRYIGTPSQNPKAQPPMPNLYFLWSVERVAMLYDLKTIGGKDWYGWGAQTLLANQQQGGHWQGGQYHGNGEHTDTCFALLFLKRSNLVPDLTENLRLHMVIRDPEAK